MQPAGQPRLVTMKVNGPFDHRHAVFLQREQLVQRDGQVVQAGDEGARKVDDDLGALAPGQPFDPLQVWAAVLVEGRR